MFYKSILEFSVVGEEDALTGNNSTARRALLPLKISFWTPSQAHHAHGRILHTCIYVFQIQYPWFSGGLKSTNSWVHAWDHNSLHGQTEWWKLSNTETLPLSWIALNTDLKSEPNSCFIWICCFSETKMTCTYYFRHISHLCHHSNPSLLHLSNS